MPKAAVESTPRHLPIMTPSISEPMLEVSDESTNAGSGAELADGAALYLKGIAVGIPALIMAHVLSAACQLDIAKQRIRISGIIYFAADVIFDYAAVKLDLGVLGIGLATSVAMYFQLGYLMLHFTVKNRILHFTGFSMTLREFIDALSYGSEKALRSLSNFISPTIVNRIFLFYGGTVVMSAFSVQKDLMSITEIFASGIADATALQMSVYYGEMNPEYIKAAGASAHKNCAALLGIIAAVLIVLAKPVAGIYIHDRGELYNMVVFASVMAGLHAPMNALMRSRTSYLNAVKKKVNLQILLILSTVIYNISSAFILGKFFGAYGLLAFITVLSFMMLVTVWIFYAAKNRTPLPGSADYLALPESFDTPPGNIISLDIRDDDDISLAAEQLQLFCKGHSIDRNTGMKAAVCVEELSVNIMRFGFPKCKKQPCIDLRVVYTDELLTVRLRDNCPMFDVERNIAQSISSTEDKDELRLGLKMIGGLAENITYVHSLETNNVIMKFPLTDSPEQPDEA